METLRILISMLFNEAPFVYLSAMQYAALPHNHRPRHLFYAFQLVERMVQSANQSITFEYFYM
jgi:hypothetical protein